MLLPLLAIVAGLVVLVWSADRFVDGAASTANHFNIPPLLIGVVIIGFGTSAPELVVSALASLEGNSGIALGNAYGSNITNIALILGITALIAPVTVDSQALRHTLPLLTLVSLIAAFQLLDDYLSVGDAIVLLVVFAALMIWTIVHGMRNQAASVAIANELQDELLAKPMPLKFAVLWLLIGLVLLIGSSRLLVWGAVEVAQSLGVSDLIIGLTIIAIGTSLPELASSIAAARKSQHDMVVGNILGSNVFNTLAVVGIAGAIHPLEVGHEVLTRDVATMLALTLSLFVLGYARKGENGLITRGKGLFLMAMYVLYSLWLASSVFLT
ncbi:MAG TPA: calcium/sodium antiporter [Pseudohongiella sp.]|nr:calcium/sodium antiporter [Pseudohongiella sp.]